MRRFTIALVLTALAAPAAGQETRPLTEDAASSIVDFYNRATTTRVHGQSRVGAGATVDGDLAALGGMLTVAGRVTGGLVVINGDLRLLPGSAVAGDVRVAGGRVTGELAGVAGSIVVYPEAIRFRRDADRLVALGPDRPAWPSAGVVTPVGRLDLRAAVDGSYNRVEGLPVSIGPRLQLGLSNPTVIDARVIYRTRTGLRLHAGELGHDVRVDQYLGGHQALFVGVGVHRVTDPIESRGLTDTENSLATFTLHNDYRDHYTRHGWSAYLGYVGRGRPVQARLEYRDERHGSMDPGSPWSLIRNQQPWRAQPRVAAGDLRSLVGSLTWDGRDDDLDPAAGWLFDLEVEQGVGGSLEQADDDFTAISIDARRYLRLGPRTRLAARAMAAGSADAGALPVQRQRVLGGEGTLPGYDNFRFDCGARSLEPGHDGFYPYYGCDRVVLLQAEARYALLADLNLGRRLGLDFDLLTAPELVLFVDAGRAWAEARALGDRLDPGPRRLRPDAGIGIRMGPLGAYVATALGDGGRTNFFVRVGPRL